ncbi:MAG: dephospho-CoA kinase [Vallitaleaceae bacterium]|nr:dephospho-CoA kinase [Vallitaleaceae bacterium]
MKTIGLIGGCGTGKSEVSMILRDQYGAYVLDADTIGHELIKKGTSTYKEIVHYFGNQILDTLGEINRKKLGDLVFNDEEKLQKLNQFTHGAMYIEMKNRLNEIKKNQSHKWVVIEAAVMIEAHFSDFIDYMWFVTCPIEKRIERLMTHRKMSLEKIQSIFSKQRSDEEFKGYASKTIDNGLNLEHTALQIQEEIDRILEEDNEK